ncbi:SgrR family transcriptional regulator [Vibrio sp. HA2012]|uniref:SgrR family transcriptional regulator n=1 Tax=Vibrio sp. HA2012 TaxID=1971595 RepID=UPI000C2B6E96|nr:SgrR family transcriptional regulator [Vibrio sp. HA2012]PJC87443.1 SgrR family transcriptional regulator [Vibrio sp. HA2012]
MSSPRLRTQFETLFEHFHGRDTDIRLEDITEVLCCTRRNARIVLNKLSEEGWIEWHPAAGRGNLSQLLFKRNQQDVSENLARRYLEEGRIGQALNVFNRDVNKLAQVIQSYLGVQNVEGQQVVRLPYYRPLSMLNPGKPNRRSEQNIIRQIFSGLTKLDEDDILQPDLAHSWEALSSSHWRFYLRNGVRFHNGNFLQIQHIIDSILTLKQIKTFGHIEQVTSPDPWVIDIKLNQPDWHLPFLFSESLAKIMPPESWRGEDFDLLPMGTGPYRVVLNDDKRLVLEAYDGYFGYRPLVDKVEVWVIDEAYSGMVFPSLSNPIMSQRRGNDDVKLDPGCTYLLLNRKHGIVRNPEWAEYLSSVLNSLNLYRNLPEDQIVELGLLPAHGLKPGWHHSLPSRFPVVPKGKRELTIAYHAQHPLFPVMAKSIETVLNQDGIKVQFIKYEHIIDTPELVDIWIKPMGIGSYREEAFAGWLLGYSDIAAMSREEDFSCWSHLVEKWRTEKDTPFPAKELGKSLVESHQIIPMFHCWLGVSKDHCGSLQNAKCNALGWFDFSQVWLKPIINT